MKNSREHRVALNDAALQILKRMAKLRQRGDDRVFPGRDGSTPSTTTMIDELRAAAGGIGKPTVHGTARSCFDDWAHQQAKFPSRLIDFALSHYPRGTAAAYRRADALAERRELMTAWGTFLCGR